VNLRLFAEEELARELGVVPVVAAVVVSGAVEEEVRINIDLKRLQALNVGLTTVLDTLRSRNLDIAAGGASSEKRMNP
jgi:multidrug efflux pump subunit AcrB